MDSDLEQRLSRGLIVEQRGFRGGRVAHRPWGQVVFFSPSPWLTLYRWPGGLGRSPRRIGSPTWTPKPSKPSHTFPPETCHNGFWYSHLDGDSFPLVRPPPLGRPGQPRWIAPQG